MNLQTSIINENLKELRSSGFEMAEGEPDIRGWKVIFSDNIHIGKIKELLFDLASKKVRYIVVDMDGKPLNLLSRDIIIPVGLAELDQKENLVYVPDVSVGHLATLPEYKKGKITYHTERVIRDVFMPSDSAAADKLAEFEAGNNPEREAFYNNEYYDENRMYNRRRREDQLKNYVFENDRNTIDKTKSAAEDNVAYIPDDKDPSLLRKVRIIKEAN
jgi:hypothetical protein